MSISRSVKHKNNPKDNYSTMSIYLNSNCAHKFSINKHNKSPIYIKR